jgi:PST family polysaccharide transporter
VKEFNDACPGLDLTMAYCLDGALGAMRRRTLRGGIYALAVPAGSLMGMRFGIVGVATGVVIALAVNYLVGAAMSLNLLKATWREYASSQMPALLLGIMTAAVAYTVRWGLLEAGAAPLIVLGVTGLVSLGVVGGLCLLRPSVLGRYGEAAVRHFAVALPARLASTSPAS